MKQVWGFFGTLAALSIVFLAEQPSTVYSAGTTYYVSSSGGLDSNGGTSSGSPFKTIAKVNTLVLQPGDRVLFKCGDTWRGEMLRVTASGTAANPITFSSYPATTCSNKPILSGAQPITGWSLDFGNVYYADLNSLGNASKFPPSTVSGVNQLFKNGQRLGIGRWPNIDAADGGYSTIDSQPSSIQFSDNELPAGDWTGATAHVKGMLWYLLNRDVTGDTGNMLTLNTSASCYFGCTGWGYWLSNHINSLDRDGEWYYFPAARRVYLYSTSGDPNGSTIEGSVVITSAVYGDTFFGGVILGQQLSEPVSHIVVENFDIRDWFDHGITYPTNLRTDGTDIILRNNTIEDVDGVGINIASWVFGSPGNGYPYNTWLGGTNIQVISNTVDGANSQGIFSYARQSLIQDNVVRNIALIKNLGQAGMGCDNIGNEDLCSVLGDGIGIIADHDGVYNGNNNTVRYNRVEQVGYVGLDVFGSNNTFDSNVVINACSSKADGSGLRSFGSSSIDFTIMHDLTVTNNIIVNTTGNTDGSQTQYRPPFGLGLYYDNYSRNVFTANNTVIGSTYYGLVYSDSTGSFQNNTLYNNALGTIWSFQVAVYNFINRPSGPSHVSIASGNIMLGISSNAGTLRVDNSSELTSSNNNHFYHANRPAHMWSEQQSPYNMTLAQWQAVTALDTNSTEMISSTLSASVIFYNDTKSPKTFPLSQPYVDLFGQPVIGNMTLQPFTSRILIPTGSALFKNYLPLILK